MSVHLDRSLQLAISHGGTSQASNDADRPHQHPCAPLGARSKPDQQQPSAEIPHPFLNSKNAAPSFNSIAPKKLLLFPALRCLTRGTYSSRGRWAASHSSGLGETDEDDAAAASLLVTAATAQTTVTTGVGTAAVQIELEYRAKIKTYVTEKKIRPVTTQERIVVGAKVPASVELEAVPAHWGPSVSKYRHVYSNDRVMLVDPGTRTVVHELDRTNAL
jgi:hypothetical protein